MTTVSKVQASTSFTDFLKDQPHIRVSSNIMITANTTDIITRPEPVANSVFFYNARILSADPKIVAALYSTLRHSHVISRNSRIKGKTDVTYSIDACFPVPCVRNWKDQSINCQQFATELDVGGKNFNIFFESIAITIIPDIKYVTKGTTMVHSVDCTSTVINDLIIIGILNPSCLIQFDSSITDLHEAALKLAKEHPLKDNEKEGFCRNIIGLNDRQRDDTDPKMELELTNLRDDKKDSVIERIKNLNPLKRK